MYDVISGHHRRYAVIYEHASWCDQRRRSHGDQGECLQTAKITLMEQTELIMSLVPCDNADVWIGEVWINSLDQFDFFVDYLLREIRPRFAANLEETSCEHHDHEDD